MVRTNPLEPGVEKIPRSTRKARGAYYTPAFLVEYILERTLDVLLSDASPYEFNKTAPRRRSLRVLDPACGAGAFLIAAYRRLLSWYLDQYRLTVPNALYSHTIVRDASGEWRLSLVERKRILTEHIFGVDVDPAAVEASAVGLVSEMLADDFDSTIEPTAKLQELALTLLAANIKCGDSLVDHDYGDVGQTSMPVTYLSLPLLSFDWDSEFPGAMQEGGFDAVVGNPPYLSLSGRHAISLPDQLKRYLFAKYEGHGWPAVHSFFVERSVEKLSRRFTAFVVPEQLAHLEGYRTTRKRVLHHSHLVEVRFWGERRFPDAVTPVLTFVADKLHRGNTVICEAGTARRVSLRVDGAPWTTDDLRWLLERLEGRSQLLGALVGDPGVHTGNCARQLLLDAEASSSDDCVPILEGKQVSRYACLPPRRALRLGYVKGPGEYFRVRPESKYASVTYVIRQTAAFPIVGPRKHAKYFRNSLLALYHPDDGTDARYLVGILNSALMRYIYGQMFPEARQRVFPQVKVSYLRQLPIRTIDRAQPADVEKQRALIRLVDTMLALHETLAYLKSDTDRGDVLSQIGRADRQIDCLVYELYGLTDEEILAVENKLTRSIS